MHSTYNSPYTRRKAKLASNRGKRMADARWKLDRERRAVLAKLNPVDLGQIIRRIVVVDDETTVREAVIYAFDSARSARRKIRAVLTK